MTINFSASDFVTVLVSHGGIAGMSLLMVYAMLLKVSHGKSDRS
jgi:hypothetical protein